MTKWKAPEPVEMEPEANWLLRVVRSLEDHVNRTSACDLCHGSGLNMASQLWPDYPPACRACAGTGKEPERTWSNRDTFIALCRRQVDEREPGMDRLFGRPLDALDPEALLWAARALGAMYARVAGLPHALRTKE